MTRIIAWGRPLGLQPHESKLHALVAINKQGANVTACNGRWHATDPGEIFYGAHVTQWPKCCACCAITGDDPELTFERQIDIGLAELVANAPEPEATPDFDLGGES